MSPAPMRRRRDADDADEEEDVFDGGQGFVDDEDEEEETVDQAKAITTTAINENFSSHKSELTASSESSAKYAAPELEEQRVDDSIEYNSESAVEVEVPGHPTFVPRHDRYFLHEDRQAGPQYNDDEVVVPNAIESRYQRLRADDVANGQSQSLEIQERRELIDIEGRSQSEETPDTKWLHDRFDLIDSDQPLPDAAERLIKSFPSQRRGGAFRFERGTLRGFRGGFRGGFRRGRGQGAQFHPRGFGFRGRPMFNSGTEYRDRNTRSGAVYDRPSICSDGFDSRRGHEQENSYGQGNRYRRGNRNGRGGYQSIRGSGDTWTRYNTNGYHNQHDDRDDDEGRQEKRFSTQRGRGRGSRGGRPFRGRYNS